MPGSYSTSSTFHSLDGPSRWLVDTCRQLGFGRIERLTVEKGLPCRTPSPRIVREIKFCSDGAERPSGNGDFQLKSQVVEMLQAIARLPDGEIEAIEVKHGLPFRMIVEEAPGS